MVTPRPFCAVCTEDILGEPIMRPLGRAGGRVRVCQRCDGEHPRGNGYGFSSSPGRVTHGQPGINSDGRITPKRNR